MLLRVFRSGWMLLVLAGVLLSLPLAPRALQAAEAAWKVLFNGHPSKAQVVEVEGRHFVPVSFPLEAGETIWEVTLKTDPAGRTVQVLRQRKAPPRRADETCRICEGDGECHSCYPTGSGMNTAGLPCMVCNGSGECDYCRGSGHK